MPDQSATYIDRLIKTTPDRKREREEQAERLSRALARTRDELREVEHTVATPGYQLIRSRMSELRDAALAESPEGTEERAQRDAYVKALTLFVDVLEEFKKRARSQDARSKSGVKKPAGALSRL